MKLTIASVLFTLLIVSLALNVGLIKGSVRIGTQAQFEQTAYTDSQRALMQALVEDAQ